MARANSEMLGWDAAQQRCLHDTLFIRFRPDFILFSFSCIMIEGSAGAAEGEHGSREGALVRSAHQTA
jgi:hypothetical protein